MWKIHCIPGSVLETSHGALCYLIASHWNIPFSRNNPYLHKNKTVDELSISQVTQKVAELGL